MHEQTAELDRTAIPPFERMARVTERVLELPAVATLDWGDRAAESLTHIESPSRVCLLIATLDSSGTIRSHEAAGVATTGDERTEGESKAVIELRSRAERLSDIGFRLPHAIGDGRCVVDWANQLVSVPTWRDTALERLWGGLETSDLAIGIGPIGGTEPGRVLIAMVGLTGEGERRPRFQSTEIEIFRAAMPRLLARTELAVGHEKSSETRWLTAREQEVLEHLTLGLSVREIAETIERSPHTVHDHVKSLHRKLNASSRGELVARALGYLDQEHRVRGPFSEASPKPSGTSSAHDELAKVVRGDGTPATSGVGQARKLTPPA